ncbi:MAG TPA: hypothetical protein VHP37_06920 [Burkholderiales bacterium]|nr:hypothetical protein [Burkholderiales bacterium]
MDKTLGTALLEAAARYGEARLNELPPAARERAQALFQNGGTVELRINAMKQPQLRMAMLDRDGNEFGELGTLAVDLDG